MRADGVGRKGGFPFRFLLLQKANFFPEFLNLRVQRSFLSLQIEDVLEIRNRFIFSDIPPTGPKRSFGPVEDSSP